jgi:hypothetical protein
MNGIFFIWEVRDWRERLMNTKMTPPSWTFKNFFRLQRAKNISNFIRLVKRKFTGNFFTHHIFTPHLWITFHKEASGAIVKSALARLTFLLLFVMKIMEKNFMIFWERECNYDAIFLPNYIQEFFTINFFNYQKPIHHLNLIKRKYPRILFKSN